MFVPRLCRVALCQSSSFLRLRKRTQSEGMAKALRENESEIGHFPSVSECKDSAE